MEIVSSVHMGLQKRQSLLGERQVMVPVVSYIHQLFLLELLERRGENEKRFWKQTSGSACKTVFSTKRLCQMSRGI